MKDKFSYGLIIIFIILEIIALYLFITERIEIKLFLLSTSSSILGIIAQKLSIDKRNKI